MQIIEEIQNLLFSIWKSNKNLLSSAQTTKFISSKAHNPGASTWRRFALTF